MRELASLGLNAYCAKKIALETFETDQEGWVVHEALLVLSALGPQAVDTIPQIFEAKRARQLRGWSSARFGDQLVSTLNSMGEGAIPFLVPYLRTQGPNPGDDPADVAGLAMVALASFGSRALPAALDALRTVEYRPSALGVMFQVRDTPVAAAPELLDLLAEDSGLSEAIGTVFAQMGTRVCAVPRERLLPVLGDAAKRRRSGDPGSWSFVERNLNSCP